ncbi:FAD-dependent oxidoreductase [Acinetobacter gerneri]|uniref:FAD-dependent oxidoreductase n=1 Tax=Acinetobacter gerneri TaxID=202952 RepID=UPI003AF92EB3
MTRISKVAIVGGGIGGMCAAIQLKKNGFNVDLIELKDTLKPLGAGISLSAATLRALKQIGVVDELLKNAGGFSSFEVFTADGHKLLEAPIFSANGAEDLAFNNAGILRTKFAEILENKLRSLGVNVILNMTVESLEHVDDGVNVQLSNGEIQNYDILIGADGINSKVRTLIHPHFQGSKFTHQGSWRIVVPRYFKGLAMFMGKTLKAGMTPINDTQSYLFLLDHHAEDNFIEQKEWPAILSNLLAEFDGPIKEIKESIDRGEINETNIVYRPLYTHLVKEPWFKGRVVLMGDAVHSTTPHLASGAGMAIEGALILTEELARMQSVEEAFERYQKRHFERAKLVISTSTRLGEIELANGSPVEHRALMSLTMEKLLEPI